MRHIKTRISRTLALFLALTMIAASVPQSSLIVSAAEVETDVTIPAVEEVETEAADTSVVEDEMAELTAAEEVEKVSESEPEKVGKVSESEQEPTEAAKEETEETTTSDVAKVDATEETSQELMEENTQEESSTVVETEAETEQGTVDGNTEETTETVETLLKEGEADGDNIDESVTETVTVSIKVPFYEEGNPKLGYVKVGYLDKLFYATYKEASEGEIEFKEYEGSLDALLEAGADIEIEVPVGETLYFKPELKEKCVVDSVYYYDANNNRQELSINEAKGVYILEEPTDFVTIYMNAERLYDFVFEVEHAKVYTESLEEITEKTISVADGFTFLIEPDEGYTVKSVDTNNTGITNGKLGKVAIDGKFYYECYLFVNKSGSIKDLTTIFVIVEEIQEYTAAIKYPETGVDVMIDSEKQEGGVAEVKFTEGGSISFEVEIRDTTKGISAKYTENGETTVLFSELHDIDDDDGIVEGTTYSYYLEELPANDISIEISVVELYTLTFKTVNNSIGTSFWANIGYYAELGYPEDYDEESGETVERKVTIKVPAEYTLRFGVENWSEYGSLFASTEDGGLIKQEWDEEGEYQFVLTPTGDTTITLDVRPAKFQFEVDDNVEFHVYKWIDDEDKPEEIDLSDDKTIGYYGELDRFFTIMPEEGKRYEVTYVYEDELDNAPYYEMGEDGSRRYDFTIGYLKKIIIKSYELTTLSFIKDIPADCELDIRRFDLKYDENENEYWESVERINQDSNKNDESDSDNRWHGSITVDKDTALYFGVKYDQVNYKLEYVSTTDNAGGNLEIYDYYDENDDYVSEWTIYRLVPAGNMSIIVKTLALETYTVTVMKREGVARYTLSYDEFDYGNNVMDESREFEFKENSKITIYDIVSTAEEEDVDENEVTYVQRVTYQSGDSEELHKAVTEWDFYDENHARHNVTITGNTTIYIEMAPVEDYTVTFADMDNYTVKIWEAGDFDSYEDPEQYPLANNKITLKNNRAYYFDVTIDDGYAAESVTAIDESGKKTILEKISGESGEEDEYSGYKLGDGYGTSGDLTIHVQLAYAYTLSFEAADTSSLSVYSWSDKTSIKSKKIAVPVTDSYSFYCKEIQGYGFTYKPDNHNIILKETDLFVLKKDYRNYKGDIYAVYTVTPKKGVEQPAKTATIVITSKENDDTHTITLEYSDKIKRLELRYYSDFEYGIYKITDSMVNISGSENVLAVCPVSGYVPVVTMKGASDTDAVTLISYRNNEGDLEYYIGELAEDKTITITTERASLQSYYQVGFVAENAIIRDSVYGICYSHGFYDDDDNPSDCDFGYYVTKGDRISFIVEPYYGYKVESVSARGTVITPDADGVYTVMPTGDETAILVRTVKAEPSEIPENPDDPANTAAVTFTYPETVSITVDDYMMENSQIKVPVGKRISFQVALTDEKQEISSVKANGIDVAYDESTGSYVLTIEADTEINVVTDPKQTVEPTNKAVVTFTYPAEVSVTVQDYEFADNKITVEIGKNISFQAALTDETYEISSVKANDADVVWDESTGSYTLTIDADTEIVIAAVKKQEGTDPEDPEKTYSVTFQYPEIVTIATDSPLSGLKAGTQISFQVMLSNSEDFEVKSVTANGEALPYNESVGGYVLTINTDTVIEVSVGRKDSSATNYPTEVSVAGVKNGNLNLSKTSSRHNITLTPRDADGSALAVKVNPADSVIKASIAAETTTAATRYILILEKPETSAGDTAVITIYNQYTGEEVSGGIFTVTTRKSGSSSEVSETGLSVVLAEDDGYDEEKGGYTYTGSAVTPEAIVYYNGDELKAGTDYTIKYSNNINASTDAKPAKITITGKGSLTGSYDKTFQIIPKNLGDSDVEAGSVKIVKNAKAAPILVYNGILLTAKDYTNPKASTKFSADDTVTLTGKGNFEGTREISVQVVDKSALNKISIKLDNKANKNLTYDGTEKYPVFTVSDAKKTDITGRVNEAYIVVYPKNIINAGTVKFTVVGIGDYTGSVTKSYKIKPLAVLTNSITVSEPYTGGYPFVSTGVTEYRPEVSLTDGTMLTEGRDYTLAYSNNKKSGVNTAKCKISFTGNYKGIKAITKTFTINPFDMNEFHAGSIVISDKISGGKPGIYKSVPYIIEDGTNVIIKNSVFKITYYVNGDPRESGSGAVEMKGSAGKISKGTVWVKIEPKNAAKGNYKGEAQYVSYEVREGGVDLSKVKVTFTPNKIAYTGSAITEEEVTCNIEYNGTTIYNSKTTPNDKIRVQYVNNVNKGKATVIITGNSDDYAGSKTAAFTIAASSIKTK